MNFCCGGFEDLLLSAGNRGLSVVVIKEHTGRYKKVFFLQARVTDSEQLFAPVTPFPVSTIMQMSIEYCMYCGKNLGRYYARSPLTLRPDLLISHD